MPATLRATNDGIAVEHFGGWVCLANDLRPGDVLVGNGGPDRIVDYVDREDEDLIEIWTDRGSFARYMACLDHDREKDAEHIYEAHCVSLEYDAIAFLVLRGPKSEG